ncbi:MAG: right-handed parallel beta-helix repeat-containing protein, partial [Candidatus Sericytochromatia bacterium]
IASGGSQPVSTPYIFPGMVNLHDTRQISLSDCQFSNNLHSDDLLHTAYVQDLKAERITLNQAYSDAWDLEFSQAKIANLQIQGSGDDGLDLMDNVLELTRSLIQDSQGNGISAGEQSKVTVSHSLIAHAGTGILAKNASVVQMTQSLLFENLKGLEIHQESPFYPGWSRITGKHLFISGGQPLALDGVSEKAIAPPVYTQLDTNSADNIRSNLAAKRQLAPLLQSLGLSEFKHLPQKLISQKNTKQP